VLDFDNADLQSLVIPERPNLIGNPNAGVCPNGAAVGTVFCWFNPSAFAVPPAGQFANAGRNILRGPAVAQFDASLHKDIAIAERRKITVGVEAYNLFNHPNFGVPSNTQSPLSLGGNGDAVFRRLLLRLRCGSAEDACTGPQAPLPNSAFRKAHWKRRSSR
jgi:hypothetical protein